MSATVAGRREAGSEPWYRVSAVELQAPPQVDPVERLKELARLRDERTLTEEEFAAQKAEVLAA